MATTDERVKELAGEMSRAFTRSKRVNGDEYIHLKDGSPKWMQDVCREAHGDMPPDDWRYEFIEEACDKLAEADDLDEIEFEADCYTARLTDWLSSSIQRPSYCDEYMNQSGFGVSDFDTIKLLQGGQILELEEVFGLVKDALTKLAEAEED